MKQYHVTWEIEVDADDTHDAAQKALEIQRDEDSTAVVFDVQEVADVSRREGPKKIRIDFSDGSSSEID